MFTINNKKQLLEVFYKKSALRNLSIFTGKYLRLNLILIKLRAFRSATLLKRDSNIDVFLWILRHFRKLLVWRKSVNGYFFIHEGSKIVGKSFSTFERKNTFTRVSFLIKIVAASNLKLSLFKNRFQHWCFSDSYMKFLTITFLKSIVIRKKALL